MKIAIIGSGFVGMSAAIKLVEAGHEIHVYEKSSKPGGLAGSFSEKNWDWSLEQHYHHIFASDHSIIDLSKKVNNPIKFYQPETATYVNSHVSKLDSPVSLLKFSDISFIDRVRTGITLGILKLLPYGQVLTNITAEKFITLFMGKNSWEIIWKPLFEGKFGAEYKRISTVWFWARIFKRSQKLGYPDGGFESLSEAVVTYAQKCGVNFNFNSTVEDISERGHKVSVATEKKPPELYDRVICTLPNTLFSKMAPSLPEDYINLLHSTKTIGAINLVISTKKSILNNVYWLNINQPNFPFLALVEHTNFISSDHYGGQHLLYVGKYLPTDHKYFKFTAKELLDEYMPYLKQISPKFKSSEIINHWIWKAPFAQPIVDKKYHSHIPSITTPLKNVFLANIQQVYPWDRGTNYAVKLGEDVAELCLKQ